MKVVPTKLFYEFGEFRLDTEKHRLLRNGAIVGATPKALETLIVLIQQRGRLVERDELMTLVWRDTVVEPGNLDVTISKLRKALGEDGHGRKFIETVPRLGYRFIADVREVVEEVPALIVEKHTSGRIVIDEEIRLGRRRNDGANLPMLSSSTRARARTAAVAAAIVILAGGLFAYFRPWNKHRLNAAPANISSIAVLPFRSVGAKDGNAHQGLGLADILITRLSNLHQITVRPTSSVATFEGTQEDSLNIARALQVDAVLEGAIYYSGDKVRVTGRMIKVNDQSTIWSGQFERLAKDELELENEIALQIVDALALNLSRDEKTALSKRYTENADAYQLYVKGRYEWNKRNYAGLSEAQRLFRNAIEKDPNFGLAYVGLADSLLFSEDKVQINAALGKALELDPNLAEAHATQGFNLAIHYWQWKEAEDSFKRSIALNPGYATTHHWYAILLEIEGRNQEAKAEMERALEIDPSSYNFLADMGQVYYFNHEYEKARDYCFKALAIYPEFSYAHSYLYEIYLQTGDYEAAFDEQAKGQMALYTVESQPSCADKEGLAHFAREKEKFRQLGIKRYLRNSLSSSQTNLNSRDSGIRYGWAMLYAFLGDKEKALDNLELAFENHAFMMPWVKAEPQFDSLRSEPRYQAILSNMGL